MGYARIGSDAPGFSRQPRTAPDAETQRPLDGLCYSDPRSCNDVLITNLITTNDVERRPHEVVMIECAGDTERSRKTAGAAGELTIGTGCAGRPASLAHGLQAVHRLDRTDEDCGRIIGFAGDCIEAPVYAVDAVHIRKTCGPEHRPVPLRPADALGGV